MCPPEKLASWLSPLNWTFDLEEPPVRAKPETRACLITVAPERRQNAADRQASRLAQSPLPL
jgi:hypothetical protein